MGLGSSQAVAGGAGKLWHFLCILKVEWTGVLRDGKQQGRRSQACLQGLWAGSLAGRKLTGAAAAGRAWGRLRGATECEMHGEPSIRTQAGQEGL